MRKGKIFISLLWLFTLLPVIPLAVSAESTLRVCDDVEEPLTLDPFRVFSEKTHTLIQQVIEALVRFDPNGKLEPALAESWERIDDKTVRFHLRKNVTFHNGEPFNSQAVKFSLERYVNPETKYPGFGFVGTISGVKVVDDNTVDVITNIPDGLLLNRLAAFCQIVAPAYYQRVGSEAFGKAPVGTGAFRFTAWVPKKEITLSANRTYWLPAHPKIDSLKFLFFPLEQQIDLLLAGKVDIVTELPGTRTLIVMENGTSRIVKRNTFYTTFASMNINRKPLSDIRVRQAINYAIDREEIMRYDLVSNGTFLASVSMPGEVGHNPSLKIISHNLLKSKELLKAAGYENGLKIKILCKTQGERVGNIMKVQLAQVGIEAALDVKTDAEMAEAVAGGAYDMVAGGCPDPMAHSFFVQSIFFFSQSPYSIVKSEEYDKLLFDMVVTLDPVEQDKKGQALDKWVYDNVFGVPMYQRIKTYAVRNSVDFIPYKTGMPFFFSTKIRKGPAPKDRKAEYYP